jgi:transposase
MRLSENQMRVLIILTWELRVASESQLASRLGLTLTRLRQLAHRLKKHGLLTSWRTTLQRAKDSAQERLKQLHEECREIKSSMKSLDAALRALDSSKASKTLKQKHRRLRPIRRESYTRRPTLGLARVVEF